MKKLLTASLLVAAISTSCSKSHETVSPSSNLSETTIPTQEIVTFDVKAAKVAPVPYQIPVQNLTVTQQDSTLNLQYLQRISLIVDAATYQNLWGATLEQDFSQSVLAGMDYTNATIDGNITLNWTTANLNDVKKTTKDTVISGVNMVKVYFERNFNFTKHYDNSTIAAAQLNLIKQQPGKISFATYYSSGDTSKRYSFTTDLKVAQQ